MRSILLAIAVLFISGCSGERLRLSSLTAGERIIIDYDRDSCRSGYRRVYEISRESSRTMMKIFELYHWGYGEDTRQTPPVKKLMGELLLNAEDMDGIESLLYLYRQKGEGESTSTEHLVVEYYRADTLLRREEFVDRTGFVLALDFPGARDDDESLRSNYPNVDLKLLKSVILLHSFDRRLWSKEPSLSKAVK